MPHKPFIPHSAAAVIPKTPPCFRLPLGAFPIPTRTRGRDPSQRAAPAKSRPAVTSPPDSGRPSARCFAISAGTQAAPDPGSIPPPPVATKCRFGAPSALPILLRHCAARPSFARCRAHGAAHSERKMPLFRSCAPLPGDVPPPARPIPGILRPLIPAATPCVFFILCAVGGLRFCLLSHFP